MLQLSIQPKVGRLPGSAKVVLSWIADGVEIRKSVAFVAYASMANLQLTIRSVVVPAGSQACCPGRGTDLTHPPSKWVVYVVPNTVIHCLMVLM